MGNYIRVVKADEDAGEVETEVVLEMRRAGKYGGGKLFPGWKTQPALIIFDQNSRNRILKGLRPND